MLSRSCLLLSAPKHRKSYFLSHRNRLLYFLDKWKYLYKQRREKMRRRVETENRWTKEPVIHPFRFSGFWGQAFPHEESVGSEGTGRQEICVETYEDEAFASGAAGRPAGGGRRGGSRSSSSV